MKCNKCFSIIFFLYRNLRSFLCLYRKILMQHCCFKAFCLSWVRHCCKWNVSQCCSKLKQQVSIRPSCSHTTSFMVHKIGMKMKNKSFQWKGKLLAKFYILSIDGTHNLFHKEAFFCVIWIWLYFKECWVDIH